MVVRWWNSGFDVANLKWQIVDLGYFWGIGATWFYDVCSLRNLFIGD